MPHENLPLPTLSIFQGRACFSERQDFIMTRPSNPADRKTFEHGKVIDGYAIVYLIGVGGFGDVYKVTDKKTHQMFAMKTERLDAQKKALDREIDCLKSIKSAGFPHLRTSGTYKHVRYLVMNMYGASVQAVRRHRGNKLKPHIALPIGKYMIQILQQFHEQGWIHRDVKPSNFLLQQSPTMPVVLIDFGLCKKHIDPETGKPFPPEEHAKFTGTRKYSSTNAHNGIDLSRRDDVISWFYSMVEMMKGVLPWGTLPLEDMGDAKAATSVDVLCADLPTQFTEIWDHLVHLEYESCPDYSFITSKIDEMIAAANLQEPDWNTFYAQNSNLGDLRKSIEMSSPRHSLPPQTPDPEPEGTGKCCSIQ